MATTVLPKIIDIRHPEYSINELDWEKWRLTYKSGDTFIRRYLRRFSVRESGQQFAKRRLLSYCPAFTKAAVNDIKNSIYQRTTDIIREGGSPSYQQAISGNIGGVDLLGSTMSYFIGQKVLPELLPMSKVGVYVDMVDLPGITTKAQLNGRYVRHPYIYIYRIEDILSWAYDTTDSPNEFSAVLLRDCDYLIDTETNLPNERLTRYRYLYIYDDQVFVKFFDEHGDQVDKYNNPSDSPIPLNISRIPFHVLDIGDSLIADVCNYQIALLNLESSDLAQALLSNYPFYVEQYDARAESGYTKDENDAEDEVEVGITEGRRYPIGVDAPSFIAPPTEPLKTSMEKGDNIKRDIRILVNLAVSNISPKTASADSKAMDMTGLESGLSYIGLILQYAEAKIGEYWSLYENVTPPTITYPTEYSLPNQDDVRKDIDQYLALIEAVNSQAFRKILTKRIVQRTVGSRINTIALNKIYKEIDGQDVAACSPDTLRKDLEAGLVSLATASTIRGYPAGDIEQAKIDTAERLASIQAAQTSMVRGVSDTPSANTNEKQKQQVNTANIDVQKPVRGEGQ